MSEFKVGFVSPVRECECPDCVAARKRREDTKPSMVVLDSGPGWIEIGTKQPTSALPGGGK